MKRRLPTIRKGEPVLAAISLPPLTADANRHRPTASHPGKAAAAPNAAADRGQREPARLSGRADRLPAQLDGQRRERHPQLRGARPEPPHPPARGRMRHARPRRRRAHPAHAAGHLPDHRADGLGHIQPPGQHERRQQRMTHPARRRSAAAARRSSGSGPPPGHAASSQTRTPAARRTTGSPGAGPPPSGQPPHRHRPAAGTAIRWPRATHRLGSLPAIGAKRGEEGSLTFKGDSTILARPKGSRQATSSKSTAGHPAGMLRKSGRQQQAGIPPGALADLIQPSHLLRTDNHIAVSLSRCLAGTRCSHYIHSLVRP